jgi:hypothetical protein
MTIDGLWIEPDLLDSLMQRVSVTHTHTHTVTYVFIAVAW